MQGEVDVLIGSRAIGTGVDGLQELADRMVMLSLPWTAAEYEQTIGRIYRQGSAFGEISVIVPEVVLKHNGDEWSWDRGRMAAIRYKRTLSDCAVDGRIPEAVRISEAALLKQSREALERWIARIGEDGLLAVERARLQVPLPPELREKLRGRHGSWNEVHDRWVRANSSTVHDKLSVDPEEWFLYHDLYRKARESWDEIPAEHIAGQLTGRRDWRIGDFGCGECLLAKALPDHDVVGLDHVAINDSVIACDMAHTPLEDGSLDAAVFSLSLMGRNWTEYLEEAWRVLKPYGYLFVGEPAKRWGNLGGPVGEHGFDVIRCEQRGEFVYLRAIKAE